METIDNGPDELHGGGGGVKGVRNAASGCSGGLFVSVSLQWALTTAAVNPT